MTDFAPAPSAPAPTVAAPAPSAPAVAPAPAVPAAGAPAGGAAAPAAPAGGNSIANITSPPSIADAVKSAREALSRGAPLPGSAPIDAPAPGSAVAQPRNPDGTFAPLVEGAPDAGAPASGDAPDGADGNEPTGEAPIDPELVVALPGRRPEDGEVELIAADKDTAERLRQLKNGFLRGEEARTLQSEAQAALREVDEFALALDVDPIGVIEQRNYAPEQRANLVLAMLCQPEVYAMVQDILPRLADEKDFRYVAAQVEADRYKQRDAATERINTERAVTQNVQSVASAIDAIVPDGLTDAQRAIFVRDARNDISRHAQSRGVRMLDPMTVPHILADRLTAYGVELNAAFARLASAAPGAAAPRSVPGGVRSAPASSGPPAAPVPPVPAGRTAAEIRTASDKRRTVAAIGPQGAGAPALSVPKPPTGSTLKEATAFARSQLGGRPR